MQQSISLITLGVVDVERATDFYRSLGWTPSLNVDGTVFFQANGVVLVLWSRTLMATDMGIDDAAPGWGGIVLAHNVSSDADVDRIVGRATSAGATITRPPTATFYGGYAGAFRDPDGHAWEIAHNPGFRLLADGSVELPPDEPASDAPPGDERLP